MLGLARTSHCYFCPPPLVPDCASSKPALAKAMGCDLSACHRSLALHPIPQKRPFSRLTSINRAEPPGTCQTASDISPFDEFGPIHSPASI